MSKKLANLLKKFIEGTDFSNIVKSLLKAKPKHKLLSLLNIRVSFASKAWLFAKPIRSIMKASVCELNYRISILFSTKCPKKDFHSVSIPIIGIPTRESSFLTSASLPTKCTETFPGSLRQESVFGAKVSGSLSSKF